MVLLISAAKIVNIFKYTKIFHRYFLKKDRQPFDAGLFIRRHTYRKITNYKLQFNIDWMQRATNFCGIIFNIYILFKIIYIY